MISYLELSWSNDSDLVIKKVVDRILAGLCMHKMKEAFGLMTTIVWRAVTGRDLAGFTLNEKASHSWLKFLYLQSLWWWWLKGFTAKGK